MQLPQGAGDPAGGFRVGLANDADQCLLVAAAARLHLRINRSPCISKVPLLAIVVVCSSSTPGLRLCRINPCAAP
jgi:hypothetical protein